MGIPQPKDSQPLSGEQLGERSGECDHRRCQLVLERLEPLRALAPPAFIGGVAVDVLKDDAQEPLAQRPESRLLPDLSAAHSSSLVLCRLAAAIARSDALEAP